MFENFNDVLRKLKVGLHFEVLTPPFRRRLIALLMAIAETVAGLLSTLRSPAIK